MAQNLNFFFMLEVSGSLRMPVGAGNYDTDSDLDKSRFRNFRFLYLWRNREAPNRERGLSESLFCF